MPPGAGVIKSGLQAPMLLGPQSAMQLSPWLPGRSIADSTCETDLSERKFLILRGLLNNNILF